MFINEQEIKSGVNSLTTIGSVSEYDVKVTECVRECNIDGEITKVNTVWIGGTITIDVNGSNIKHSFKYLDTIRHLKNGNINKSFTSIMTALGYNVEFNEASKKLDYIKTDRNLTPKVEGKITFVDADKKVTNTETIKGGVATRVKISGKLGLSESLNKDQSDLVFYDELPVSFISTTNVDDNDESYFTVEGVVKNIVDEMGTNGSATGRYLVDLITPNFFGVDVFSFVMLDKWTNVIDGEEVEFSKEDFYDGTANSFCQIGDSIRISGNIEGHSFGAPVETTTTAKKTFGGGAKNVRGGFSRVEWTIKSGDSMDEAYDMELIKQALEEREVYIEKTYQSKLDYAKNNPKTDNSAPANPAQTASKPNPFSGGGASKPNPFGGAPKKNPFA